MFLRTFQNVEFFLSIKLEKILNIGKNLSLFNLFESGQISQFFDNTKIADHILEIPSSLQCQLFLTRTLSSLCSQK